MRENYSDVSHNDKKWDLKFGTETFEREGTGKDALLSVPQCALPELPDWVAEMWRHCNFGLDMPTWMVKRGVENPRRVMIVSEDPLRTGHPAGKLLLSTPFGFHSEDYRKIGCLNDSVYDLVWRFLDKSEVCVYLTDSTKFYANDGKTKNDKYVFDKKFKKMFETTFETEIKTFKPNVVLTLGKPAAEFCGIKFPRDGFHAQEVCGRKYVASYHPKAYLSDMGTKSYGEYFDLVFHEVDAQIRGVCS